MRDGLIDDFIHNILSIPFCPYHFVRYHFVREPHKQFGLPFIETPCILVCMYNTGEQF